MIRRLIAKLAAALTPDTGPPCTLCRGTMRLEGEDGPFPCLCTPAGRLRANGCGGDTARARVES